MSKCSSCGASIHWAVTEKRDKRIHIDVEPVPDGNLVIDVQERGRRLVAREFQPLFDQDRQAHRFRSHFASCPYADEHRKSRERTKK